MSTEAAADTFETGTSFWGFRASWGVLRRHDEEPETPLSVHGASRTRRSGRKGNASTLLFRGSQKPRRSDRPPVSAPTARPRPTAHILHPPSPSQRRSYAYKTSSYSLLLGLPSRTVDLSTTCAWIGRSSRERPRMVHLATHQPWTLSLFPRREWEFLRFCILRECTCAENRAWLSSSLTVCSQVYLDDPDTRPLRFYHTKSERGARGLPPGGDGQFHRNLECTRLQRSPSLSPSSRTLISPRASLTLSDDT